MRERGGGREREGGGRERQSEGERQREGEGDSRTDRQIDVQMTYVMQYFHFENSFE